MKIFAFLAPVACALISATPAVSAVRYELTATTYAGVALSFSFTTADFLNSPSGAGTVVPFAQLDSCTPAPGTVCDKAAFFNNIDAISSVPDQDAVALFMKKISDGSTSYVYFYFADGALLAPNTYSSLAGSGRATLTVLAIPEAPAWAMMLAGFAAIGVGLRARRKATPGRTVLRLSFS